jgi:hypothetical protein
VTPKARIRILGTVALVAAWVLVLALTGSPAALLFAAPFFMLAVLLSSGETPGAELIARVLQLAPVKRRAVSDRGSRLSLPAGFRPLSPEPISSNLAGRAPPPRLV